MKRHILLVNRASGGNERGFPADEVCRITEEAFREKGLDLTARGIPPEQIEEEIRKAVAEKPDAILIGGGDGTVSTAARLLGGTGIPLGILPMGTFNLAARDLGVPLDIAEAATFLAEAEALDIDVLDVSGHSCLCTTILGFYPEFSDIFEKRDHGGRWWRKTFKLLTSVPKIYSRARPLSLAWKADGEVGRARTKFSAFVPGSYRSSAGIVPARTDFRSGTLTGYIGTHKTAAAALRAVFDYVLGRHEQNAELMVLKAREMELRASKRKHATVMLDGEILRLELPIHLRILPSHLRVLSKREVLEPPAPETE